MRDCPGGWYAVRPLGFVCANEHSTLDLDVPVVRALEVEPDRSKPLPYAYAFAMTRVPNYMRVPSPSEQLEHEPGLLEHLRSGRGLEVWVGSVATGADDAPVGQDGLARRPVPGGAPLDASARFGMVPEVPVPWWLQGQRGIPNLATFDVPPGALVARNVQPHSGVALIGTFVSDGKRLAPGASPETPSAEAPDAEISSGEIPSAEVASPRRFGITPDGRLLPTDRLQVATGSTFHGRELRELGLPVAFGWRQSARFWSLEQGRLVPGRPLTRREFVPLTGRVRDMAGARMLETKGRGWLRSDDLRVADRPSEMPWFAAAGRRWIDVSIESQTLVLWEGATPVYATLVSTGKDDLRDPKRSTSTPRGIFRILQKHVTTTMDSTVAQSEFELRDVPWVMYFQGGYALHAAYWHDDFGRQRSHGCVNLSPIDARHVFQWSLPDVPEHWHGAYASASFGKGTLIRIGG